MKVLTAIITDTTVAYWLKDETGPAEPVASVVNHGMTVDQVSDLGLSLIGALSLNGAKPEPVKREPRKAPAPKKRGRVASYNLSADTVLADIRAHPGTTCLEAAGRLFGSGETGHMQVVNRRAGELHAAGKITFSERVDPRRKGRPARTYYPAPESPLEEPVSSSIQP